MLTNISQFTINFGIFQKQWNVSESFYIFTKQEKATHHRQPFIFVNVLIKNSMCNLQKKSNILHFWVKSQIPGAFMVESDLIEDYCLVWSDFEEWLLNINRIGCFYDDHPESTGDIIITLEDVMEDETELNDLINDYFMENIIPKSGIEFEHLLQAYKHANMWDSIPMPTADKYAEIEGQQRPQPEHPKEEKELLKTI